MQPGTRTFAHVSQDNNNVRKQIANQALYGTGSSVTASQSKFVNVLSARLTSFLTKLLANAKQDHIADLNAVLNQWFGKQAIVNVCSEKYNQTAAKNVAQGCVLCLLLALASV